MKVTTLQAKYLNECRKFCIENIEWFRDCNRLIRRAGRNRYRRARNARANLNRLSRMEKVDNHYVDTDSVHFKEV